MVSDGCRVSIIGRACKLPGANSVEEFWSNLKNGVCSVKDIGNDRWSPERFFHPERNQLGKSYVWRAGFVDRVYDFDPTVFGISPREATQMDPQQRLALQTSWEAMEDAGIPPGELAGSNIGVFVGASSFDYAHQTLFDVSTCDPYFATGNTLSISANRISYIFGLMGPSFTVDTACSSSLVALDAAYNAIKSGRIDTAIVTGVSVLVTPFMFLGFAAANMLSPEGLCRAFDDRGMGYVRSEGCVTIILRREDIAIEQGNHAHSTLLATGINSDGRTVGMSLPSSHSQGALLEQIYRENELDANQLAFIEAHGTGTKVGDPAEAGALGRELGQHRSAPLPIGSVKTNVGHLEPASGLVGLLKASLALENDHLPPTLHFEVPNTDIDFDGLNLHVAADGVALDARADKDRLAGINSFGFGGTNAHAVITDGTPPAKAAPGLNGSGQHGAETFPTLVLSAASADALGDLAQATKARLDDIPATDAASLTAAIGYQRQPMMQRLVVQAENGAQLAEELDRFIAGEPVVRGTNNRGVGNAEPVVFVFAGNGSQWAGMGIAAYEGNAAYRSKFDEISAIFEDMSGWSLVEKMRSEDLADQLSLTEVAQPMLFAVQVALSHALVEHGLTPDMVLGHSVGEVAAAAASGSLTLTEAVNVVHKRSIHQEEARGAGTMAALILPPEQAQAVLDEHGFKNVTVAAINSPKAVTVSGDVEEINQLSKIARKNRWILKKLDLEYPFHSPMIELVREPLLNDLADLQPGAAIVPMISTVTGETIEAGELDADYWWRNVRQPVLFSSALERAVEQGGRVFVEITPKAILQSFISTCISGSEAEAAAVPSLDRKDDPANDPVRQTLARAVARGARFDAAQLFGSRPAHRADVPRYPWQFKEYKRPDTQEAFNGLKYNHPLLGFQPRQDTPQWYVHLDAAANPWIADHQVEGQVVVPGSALLEMILAAGRLWLDKEVVEATDIELLQALVLAEGETREVTVRLSPESNVVEILSRPRLVESEWQFHAKGRVGEPAVKEAPQAYQPSTEGDEIEIDHLYALTRQFGLGYGPIFQRVTRAARIGERIVEMDLSGSDFDSADMDFGAHPAVVDACFHGLVAIFADLADGTDDKAYLPVRFGEVRLYRPGEPITKARLEIERLTTRGLKARFELLGADGELVLTMADTRFRSVSLIKADSASSLLYQFNAVSLPPVNQIGNSTLAALAPSPISSHEENESDSWLLLEAHARRVIYDQFEQLADDDHYVDIELLSSNDQLSEHGRVYAAALLEELATIELAEADENGYRLAPESGLPDADTLLQTIVADQPEWLAEAVLATQAGATLQQMLNATDHAERYSGPMRDHFGRSAPAVREVSRRIDDRLRSILAQTAQDQPVRILELTAGSISNRAIVDELDNDGRLVTLADPDTRAVERTRNSFIDASDVTCVKLDEAELKAAGPFDIVVVRAAHRLAGHGDLLDMIKPLLASGGHLISADPLPNVVFELMLGGTEYWYDRTVDSSFPISALRFAEEWKADCDEFGMAEVEVSRMSSAGVPYSLLHAKAVAAVDTAPASTERNLLALGLPDSLRNTMADAIAPFDQMSISDLAALAPAEIAQAMRTAGDGASDLIVSADRTILDAADPSAALRDASMGLNLLLQSVNDLPIRVWLWLPGGAPAVAGAGNRNAVAGGLWRFARVAMNEFTDVDIHLIDQADTLTPEQVLERLIGEIAIRQDERELVLFEDRAVALRIAEATAGEQQVDDQDQRIAKLGFDRAGTLNALRWETETAPDLKPGDVVIDVAAAGLNFRDVMWSLGMLPEEALEDGFAGPTLGIECSGTVSEVGSDVTKVKPGDRVITFAPACFASHVTVDQIAVAPLPDNIPLEAAATMPVAFLTSYYALHHLAHLEADEWVLIHGGAGGVGLSAIQIAQWLGAKIIATAGTDEKREFLRMMGVDHVLDSRSLAFAEEVRELTGGEGVDVVLNSLSGEAMERSIAALKPFGRFCELGKRDYYANTRIGLRPFRRNLSYFGIDADQLLSLQPKLADRLFAEMVGLFEDEILRPLPYRKFDWEEAVDAFRLMQQSGHIGKIIVTPPRADEVASAAQPAVFEASASGTHLVIGGLGGFGIETARWLADSGAKSLVLTSRRGAADTAGQQVLDELSSRGISVRTVACDATSEDDLRALITEIEQSDAPLSGVLHTAMVLDDALLSNLDGARFEKVLRPKVDGAALLSKLTEAADLDYFVLFSSMTTFIGNPGQANYVAANGYLETLCEDRRSQGNPALAVAWGAIGDAGYLTRNEDVGEMLAKRMGGHALGAREGLNLLGDQLARPNLDPTQAVIAIGRIDWAAAKRELAIAKTPMMAPLMRGIDLSGGDDGDMIDVAALIAGKDAQAARDIVADLLTVEVAKILRLPAEDVNRQRPLSEIGMDSLMALELRTAVQQRLGLDVPAMAIADGTTLNDIAVRLVGRVTGGGSDSTGNEVADQLLVSHSQNEDADENINKLVEEVSKQANTSRKAL